VFVVELPDVMLAVRVTPFDITKFPVPRLLIKSQFALAVMVIV
jgi:hypothetical protein